MSALVLVPLAPVVVAVLLVFGARSRAVGLFLAPWAALPALMVASVGAVEPQRVSWLLLGTELAIDPLGRAFLLFTALVWTASGVFARSYVTEGHRRVGYFLFHCLTLAGNLALIVAADAVTFYLGFALMTFAAYGLVVHAGSAAARRAGRVYLAMSVLAEGALIAALLLAVAAADGDVALSTMPAAIAAAPARDLIVGLLLVGFGVKAGALPLHVWLPLAHPVAPTPASAVLSGCMIKAGLLGWLRFLPLGEAALGGWGAALVATGLAAALLAALAGAAQNDAKTTLAYSSISQMGLMIVAVGIGLAVPTAAGAAVATAAAYAAHHALAKGALFLGVGALAGASRVAARRIVLTGLVLPAAALAAAPFSAGAIAKSGLKDGISSASRTYAYHPHAEQLRHHAADGALHAPDAPPEGDRAGTHRPVARPDGCRDRGSIRVAGGDRVGPAGPAVGARCRTAARVGASPSRPRSSSASCASRSTQFRGGRSSRFSFEVRRIRRSGRGGPNSPTVPVPPAVPHCRYSLARGEPARLPCW